MRIPKHLAIIPDGNRRWAVGQGLPKQKGYEHGLSPGLQVLHLAKSIGIQELTFYGYTTDNVKRPSAQVTAFTNACVAAFEKMQVDGCQILVLGDTSVPSFPKELLPYTNNRVGNKSDIRVNFLVNYGWEWDLGQMKTASKRRQDIVSHLKSNDVSFIDLILRWGGHTRLSGLLPVQSVYADFYSIDAMWPDFKEEHFHNALAWYQGLDITKGG